jgi:hypothetical protein
LLYIIGMTLFSIVIVAALVIKWCESSELFWILAWPGTVMHELLHAAVGLLLLAQPCNFNILPRMTEHGRELGSVGFSNLTWYNKLPIALAPLLAIPIVFIATNMLVFSATVAGFATVWILASMLSQALPSTVDWEIGLSSPVGIAAWAGVVYLLIR